MKSEAGMANDVRINPRVLWGLSEAQLIASVMITAGFIAWYRSRKASILTTGAPAFGGSA
jgi:hypothetical protein